MSAHILLIEDDPALLTILQAAIAFGGFSEQSVGRGRDALAAFDAAEFDAVLIDLGLPDMDGAELLQSLRERSDVPIIVVSGRGAERDKIEALDLGADDYVSKPFLPGELLARVRAALRRHMRLNRPDRVAEGGSTREPIAAGALRLDPLDRSVSLGDRRTVLSGAEFRILKLLAEQSGAVVTKNDMLDLLYRGDPPPGTRVIEVYISKIRRKLLELDDGEMVLTVRGEGWQLMPPEAQA